MTGWMVHTSASRALDRLVTDLRTIFGGRLGSVVAYGACVVSSDTAPPAEGSEINSLALVSGLEFGDLAACAERASAWDAARLAMPLLLSRDEFISSLDAFPIEFGDILARHVTCLGSDPFEGVRVSEEDLRRACEVQAKSHLIHLREGFLESAGEAGAVGRLIQQSIPSFTTLLSNLARLEQHDTRTNLALAEYAAARLGVAASLVERVLGLTRRISDDEAVQLYAPYHDATATIAAHVDRWKAPARA